MQRLLHMSIFQVATIIYFSVRTMTRSMWGGGGMTNKEIHSECRSVPTRERKLHWSKPFLVLHPLKSSQIKKKTRQNIFYKGKYSIHLLLWHENTSRVYIRSETVSIHIGQNSPCSRARKLQIKCEATSWPNIAQKQTKTLHTVPQLTW